MRLSTDPQPPKLLVKVLNALRGKPKYPNSFVGKLGVMTIAPYQPRFANHPALVTTGDDNRTQMRVNLYDQPFNLREVLERGVDISLVNRTVTLDRNNFYDNRDALIMAARQHPGSQGLKEIMKVVTKLVVPEADLPNGSQPLSQRECLVWGIGHLLEDRRRSHEIVTGQRPITNREYSSVLRSSYDGSARPNPEAIPYAGNSWVELAQTAGDIPYGNSTLRLPSGRFTCYWFWVPRMEQGFPGIHELMDEGVDVYARLKLVNGRVAIGFAARAISTGSYQESMKWFRTISQTLTRISVRNDWIGENSMSKYFQMFLPGSAITIPDNRMFIVPEDWEEELFGALVAGAEQIEEPGELYLGTKGSLFPVLRKTGHRDNPPVFLLVGGTGSGKSTEAREILLQLTGVNNIEITFSSDTKSASINQTRRMKGPVTELHFPSPDDPDWQEPDPNLDLTTYFPLDLVEKLGAREQREARYFVQFVLPDLQKKKAEMPQNWMTFQAPKPEDVPVVYKPKEIGTNLTIFTLAVYEYATMYVSSWASVRRRFMHKLGHLRFGIYFDDISSMAGGSQRTATDALSSFAGTRMMGLLEKWATNIAKENVVLIATQQFDNEMGSRAPFPQRIEFPGNGNHKEATLLTLQGNGTYLPTLTFNPYLEDYEARVIFCREP